ncbi:MAG TPA: hypothetical protein VLA20_09430 [Vicinamibacterales bacterium]|nr:hypothetical protein [Vicinamibacterales bacterium]
MFRTDAELRSAARALACAFVISLVAPLVASEHADVLCPADCPDGVVAPVDTGEGDKAVRQAVDAEHCQLCHWLRDISRAVPQPTSSAAIDLNPAAGLRAEHALGRSPRGVDERPSRSPPRPLL